MVPALRRVLGLVAALSIAALPVVVQPGLAVAASAGTLYAVYGETQVVSLDPATGARTTIADFSTPPPSATVGDLVADPANHRLISQRTVTTFDPTLVPPLVQTYQVITVDTSSGATTISPDLAQPVSLALDSSTGALLGMTACCPVQIVRVDPSTGIETPLATLAGAQFSSMAIATATHSLYAASIDFSSYPPTETLVQVNTVTGTVSQGPNLATGVIALGYDTSTGMLIGKTFCCPTHLVLINPTTGAESTIGNFDLGLGNSLAVDSTSHTVYVMEDVQGAFSFDQFVGTINEKTGAISLSSAIPLNGYIRSLAFASVAITPASIEADVRSALSSGAIDNEGVAESLLTKLDAASEARSEGRCKTAANHYRSFINELNAQSGRHVTAATASQLIGEAQFLIANCP